MWPLWSLRLVDQQLASSRYPTSLKILQHVNVHLLTNHSAGVLTLTLAPQN